MKEFTLKELKEMNNDSLITLVLAQQGQLSTISKQLDYLTEQIATMNQRAFGKKTEVNDSFDGQLSFGDIFNEAEFFSDDSPEPEIEEIIVSTHTRKKKVKGKREADLEGLPARVIQHTIPEEELNKLFPNGYKELPETVYKRLSIIPQTFIVDEHHVHVYASKDNDGTIIKADRPADIFRNSIATAPLMAVLYNGKYAAHQPIERQSQMFKSNGVKLETNTLCNWVIKGSEDYLSKLYDLLHEMLYDSKVIHADETPVKVTRVNGPSNSKSYMWVYCNNTNKDKHPIVIYDYQRSRRADHPREFLKDFSGTVVTDGYQVYHTIDKERQDLTVAGCWVHAKRKFAEIVKSLGETGAKGTIAKQAEDMISEIFFLDNQLDELSKREREKRRKLDVKPKVNAFFEWAHKLIDTCAVQGQTARAIEYCLNQEQYLRVFLNNGDVPMENNAAERAIRPFTLGRKNWGTIDTERGAQASAVAYSIVETAKANHLKVIDYFELLFTEMSKHKDDETNDYLYDLLPWNKDIQKKCLNPNLK
ncbi:MAG: IS66 family transposase [Pseudobutyrivibrio ruminis]|uniref:IS66 family transposase n=1 Tax=Pseudobutyrivibrio ruminis TaxID=46206 RepID=A0A927U955_9FIRM|nr:IS66 family transposase [Pseudobutyrivibrio ruminis]